MRKVGIITFHRADNFGAVLQNFALQQALLDMDMEPETIDYRCPQIEKIYKPISSWITRHPIRMLNEKYWQFRNLAQARKSINAFNNFRKNYLRISNKSFSNNTINKSDYDLYITGSDQVWNNTIISPEDYSAFTLSFTNRPKVSYGASCGGNKFLIDALDDISQLTKVTVREEELQVFLKRKGIESKLVCDPVFLLDKEKWITYADKVGRYPNRYVYLYYVESGKEETAAISKKIANDLGCEVVFSKKEDRDSVRDNYGISKFSDGPLEFINRIKNAEFVVVSSFHGAAFSIIFEKQFYVVLHKNTGDRVRTLLKTFGLENRIITCVNDLMIKNCESINYSKVNHIMENVKNNSMQVLYEIVNMN